MRPSAFAKALAQQAWKRVLVLASCLWDIPFAGHLADFWQTILPLSGRPTPRHQVYIDPGLVVPMSTFRQVTLFDHPHCERFIVFYINSIFCNHRMCVSGCLSDLELGQLSICLTGRLENNQFGMG
jgi:hypothetical protein